MTTISLLELLRDWTAFAFWQSFLFLGLCIVFERFLRRSPWQAHLVLTLGIFASVLAPTVSLLVGGGMVSPGSMFALERTSAGLASVLGPMIFGGGFLFAVFLLRGIVSARKLMFRANPFPDRESQEALLEGSRMMQNVSLPILFTSAAVKSPTVWSWGLHPAVLLPESLSEKLTPQERDAIFLHELAHIIRQDHWAALLNRLCGIVLFWNPLYWIAVKLADLAADRACDLLVLSREKVSPEIYGETLLRLAAGEKDRPALQFYGQYLSRKEQLMKRLDTILDFEENPKRFSVTRTPLRTLGTVACVLCMTAALAMCQENRTAEKPVQKPSYEKVAGKLIERFSKNDFSDDGFTQAMKDAKISDIAKSLWDDFSKQFGKFTGSKTVKTESLLEFHRVHENCRFDRGNVTLMVVVDKNDLVAGLFVMSVDKKEGKETAEEIPDFVRTPKWHLEQESQDRPPHVEVWNGKTNMMSMILAMRLGGRKWLELTDEQQKKLGFLGKQQELGVEWFQKIHQERNAELIEAEEAAKALIPSNDPLFEKATEAQKRAYVEAASKPSLLFYRHVQKEVTETLTPEQLRKLRSLEFSLLPEIGEPTPHMFDSLGLSEEQQKKVEAIKKELEPEFLKLLDEQMELRKEHLVLYTQGKNSQADRKEYNARHKEQESRRIEFSKRLKARLEKDVLTEEQRVQAEKLAEQLPGSMKQLFHKSAVEKVRSYRVDKKISEFPGNEIDLTTPEAAYALSNRIIGGDAPDRIASLQQYTVNRSIPDNMKTWVESMPPKDRKLVGEATILHVFVYKDRDAMVVAEIEKDKRYNTRLLSNEYGRWFNIGGGGFFGGKSGDDVVKMCEKLFQREVERWDKEKPAEVWKTPDQVGYTHLVVFEAVEPFEPKNAKELLDVLNEQLFKRNDILTGYFRTETNSNGKLVGRICTTNPTRLRELIDSIPELKLEKIWQLDQKKFEEHTGQKIVEAGQPAPKVVKLEPANGAKDVDAEKVTELRVTFDRDMNTGGFSWCGGGEDFPYTPGQARWTDKRTCVLPVELEAGKTYRLSINAMSFKNFRSESGVPVEPVPYSFSTGEKEKPIISLPTLPPMKETQYSQLLPDGLLQTLKEKRQAVKNADYTVRWFSVRKNDQHEKDEKVECKTARFRFDGSKRWFADISEVMQSKIFQTGCDGTTEWSLSVSNRGTHYQTRRLEDIREIWLSYLDPLGLLKAEDGKLESALESRKLKYFGTEKIDGKEYHLFGGVSSRKDKFSETTTETEIAVDAETGLPGPVRTFTNSKMDFNGRKMNSASTSVLVFEIGKINAEFADADFRPENAKELEAKANEKPEEGYDTFFVLIDDGSGGRMRVRSNGQRGPKGMSSSGLN